MPRKLIAAIAVSFFATTPVFADTSYPDLLERVEAEGNFKTFIAAAKAAGLTDALKGSDKLTVFAPTDEAFAALPKGEVERLLKPENKEQLAKLLKSHIVPGQIFASTWANELSSVTTKAGTEVKVDGRGSPFKIGEATVVAMNVTAANGKIHVIDKVLSN